METKTLRRDANQVIIPSFAHVSGDAEKAEAIAKWVLTEIKEENWEPDLYATKFGFRTPRETLTERTRGFMAPCLDSSMAANIIFQNEGFDTTAVVDVVHIASENRNQLHTALEVTKSGKTWHFGVAPGRKGYLMGGKYKNPAVEGWTSLGHPLKFEGRRVGLDTKPFQAFFGITTMGELGTSITGCSAEDIKARIAWVKRHFLGLKRTFESVLRTEHTLATTGGEIKGVTLRELPAEKIVNFVKPKPGEQLDFTHALMNQEIQNVKGAIEWAEAMGTNTVQVSERGMPCPTALGLSVGRGEACKTQCPVCHCLPGYRIVRAYLGETPSEK